MATCQVSELRVRTGALVDQITFVFADGRTAVFGRPGGSAKKPFRLNAGEYISRFTTRNGDSHDGCSFTTNTGHTSAWYGGHGGSQRIFDARPGQQIVGFELGSGLTPRVLDVIQAPAPRQGVQTSLERAGASSSSSSGGSNTWTCSICTFQNEAARQQCAMCEAPRPWICAQCTLLNEPGLAVCSACEAPRGDAGPFAASGRPGLPGWPPSRRRRPGVEEAPWTCAQCTLQNDPLLASCSACDTPRRSPGALQQSPVALLGDAFRLVRGSRRYREPTEDLGRLLERAVRDLQLQPPQHVGRTGRRQRASRRQRTHEVEEDEDEVEELRRVLARSVEESEQVPQTEAAASAVVAALPIHRLSAAEVANASDDANQCMVCLEHFQADEQVKLLPCFHRYHVACVDEWLRRDGCCPVCKHRLDD